MQVSEHSQAVLTATVAQSLSSRTTPTIMITECHHDSTRLRPTRFASYTVHLQGTAVPCPGGHMGLTKALSWAPSDRKHELKKAAS